MISDRDIKELCFDAFLTGYDIAQIPYDLERDQKELMSIFNAWWNKE